MFEIFFKILMNPRAVKGLMVFIIYLLISLLKYFNLLPEFNFVYVVILYLFSGIATLYLIDIAVKYKRKQNLELLKQDMNELLKKGVKDDSPRIK